MGVKKGREKKKQRGERARQDRSQKRAAKSKSREGKDRSPVPYIRRGKAVECGLEGCSCGRSYS